MTFVQIDLDRIQAGDVLEIKDSGGDRIRQGTVRRTESCGTGMDIVFQEMEQTYCSSNHGGDTFWRQVPDVRPRVGDVFTRTYTTSREDRVGATVTAAMWDDTNNWTLVTYDHLNSQGSRCRVLPNGDILPGSPGFGGANGRYILQTPTAEPQNTWTRVYEGQVAVGDWIRAVHQTDPSFVREGEVTDVAAEYLTVNNINDGGLSCIIDMDFNDVDCRSTPELPWHPITFQALKVNDKVRASYPDGSGTIQGTITARSNTRITINTPNGRRQVSGLRKFEVQAAEAPVLPSGARFPTIHHLKAALFDIITTNYDNGTWCGEANEFVRELGIAENLYEDQGLKDQADQVDALLAQLRRITPGSKGVREGTIVAAFKTLGVPRSVEPETRRYQLEIDVPAALTLDQLRAMVQGANNNGQITLARDPQEVPRNG